jgi:intein/homing endonuclease
MEPRLVEKLDLMIDRMTGQNKDDNVVLIDGDEGCLSGDTQIQISKAKLSRRYSLEHLYNCFKGIPNKGKLTWRKDIPSFVRSFNGNDIRLHKINNVVFSGIKRVSLLTLENGLSIKVTSDHKFLTRDNQWVELLNLKEGQEIMCDTLNAEGKKRKRIKLYDIQLPVGRNHPYCSGTGRIEVHRLIYEARMNNLSFTEYLDTLLNEPEICKTLKYINPATHEIHHKDGNHYNNSIENLELLLINEHRIEHGDYSNFSQGIPKFSKVVSIKYVGEEKTYDIQCEETHHNFVANGIVVHNSGKTQMGFGIC